MNRKILYIKVLRIVTGSGLVILCAYGLYNAYGLQLVQNKGATYSLADEPIRFFMIVGVYIIGVVIGPYLIAMGVRANDD